MSNNGIDRSTRSEFLIVSQVSFISQFSNHTFFIVVMISASLRLGAEKEKKFMPRYVSDRNIATERIKTLVQEYDHADPDRREFILIEIEQITESLSKMAYTDDELCQMMGVSAMTTYRWRKNKIIDYCYLTAKHVCYLPEHITTFLQSRVALHLKSLLN